MSKIKYNRSLKETLKEYYSFCWEIKNFISLLNDNCPKEYHMKNNLLEPYPQLKINLPNNNNDIIHILCLWPAEVQEYKYNAVIWVGQKTLRPKDDTFVKAEANIWMIMSSLSKKDIQNNKGQYLDLVNGIISEDITFHIKFKVIKENVKHTMPEAEVLNRLYIHLEEVFDLGCFSDAIMKSEDGVEYKVHKVILGCRSDVLRAHFEHNTTESKTNIVEAPFESEIVDEILSYIYVGKVKRIEEIPGKILAAADYYQLIELKRLCGREMCKKLSVQNVLNTLELAQLYSEEFLQVSALDFIKYGNTVSVIKTESWNDISVEVLKAIYVHIHSKSDHDIVYCDIMYDPLENTD